MKTKDQKALEFLNQIKNNDKVALVFHDDLDGFASGIIFYEFLEKIGCKISLHPFTLGKDSLTKYYEDIKNKKIIILDLALNALPELKKIKEQTLYIDHHNANMCIFNNHLIEYKTDGYIPISRVSYELLKENLLISFAGTISDAADKYNENQEFINDCLNKFKISLEQFKEEFVYPLGRTLIYFEHNLIEAFWLIKKIKSIGDIKQLKQYSEPIKTEINLMYEDYNKNKKIINEFCFYELKQTTYNIKSILINEISFSNPDKIFIFALKDGDIIKISARNQTKKYDMSDLLKKLTTGILNSTAGGHSAAAGAVFSSDKLIQFKKNIENYKID